MDFEFDAMSSHESPASERHKNFLSGPIDDLRILTNQLEALGHSNSDSENMVTISLIWALLLTSAQLAIRRVAVISAKNHKRQRRKRQSVTAKREKSQTPKFVKVR